MNTPPPAVNELTVLRLAFERAPIPLVVYASDGSIIAASDAARALLGGGSAAVVSERSLADLATRASASGEAQHDAVEVYGPPRRSLDLTAVPLGSTGASVALVEDTTERRRIELARRDLVSNISHELRTPVGAIALLAETIAGEDDPETVRRLGARLDVETQRLSAMLNDVLALSRLETAGTTDRHEVDLSDLVRFCCARLRAHSELLGVSIEAGSVEDGHLVMGDRALLTTAVDNLLDNAVKYSDKNEPVRVAVRRRNGWVELTIADSGIGIPLRDRQRIFERFYRVDRARSRDTGGSGIGLAIVRHVAVNHDGEVEVDSLEGVGSMFTLRLPAVVAGQAPGQAGGQGGDRG